jgi:hypothetical protein
VPRRRRPPPPRLELKRVIGPGLLNKYAFKREAEFDPSHLDPSGR